ncbi:MAG: N-(5'-phosphoribosyl)anthranilate isomerase, partial [Gammaproteobacteria bacterium AqS3]|nr:N-(5'-phosphoribosyl)anthranilate isomerase [Gammaproteobacteria bacterium AqS3]
MQRCRVKICGITSVADALAAVDAGADAIGLMRYAPSPRYVSLERIRAIKSALPPLVSTVAVMVNPEASEVEVLLEEGGIDIVQFHGEESPEFCKAWGRPFIKALQVRSRSDIECTAMRYPEAQALLLDTKPSADV